MARCNCRYDKKQLDTKTAFKVVIKEKNTYFCTEDCYSHYLADKEKLQKEYETILKTMLPSIQMARSLNSLARQAMEYKWGVLLENNFNKK